jgi:hypothetical protein
MENEFGSYGDVSTNPSDKQYMEHLVGVARSFLGPNIILYTTDGVLIRIRHSYFVYLLLFTEVQKHVTNHVPLSLCLCLCLSLSLSLLTHTHTHTCVRR